MENVNIRADDGIKLRRLFKEIVYSVFGIFLPSQESKKLDIATGGEDMTKLKDEEQDKEFIQKLERSLEKK